MNKRLLTTIVTHLVRGAFFLALLFSAINMIRLAQGQQPQSSKRSQTNSETSRNGPGDHQRRKDHRKSSRYCGTTADCVATTKLWRHWSSRSIRYYLWRGVPCRARPDCP